MYGDGISQKDVQKPAVRRVVVCVVWWFVWCGDLCDVVMCSEM